jgi:PD-(D/E)XK nuclease superfamily
VHRLLEEAGRGELTNGSTTKIAQRWQELVDEAEQSMRASALEKRFVPLRDTAPKYEVARLRAEARAGELARKPALGETRAGEATASPYGYELRVESADGLIAGRIDRALATEHGTVLQDYKSGAIFSLQEGDVRQIKPEYAQQLRLYAALYFEATGTWPVRLELVPLAGDPQEVSFSQEECLRLLERAKALLADVNQQLARVPEGWDAVEASLATPSAAACRFCSFRPACSPYLSTERPAEDREWPADVCGSFQSLIRLGNGRWILRAARNDGTHFFVRDLPEQLAAEAMASAREGILVGAFNLRRTGSPQAFEAGALTTLYCQPDPQDRGSKME